MKNTTVAKKAYKAPTSVKSIKAGKITQMLCASGCGSSVSHANSNCGH